MVQPPGTVNPIHNRIAVLTLGTLQISLGIILVVLDVADFAFNTNELQRQYHSNFSPWNTVFGSGIWAGVFFILSGTFGIMSARRVPSGKEPRNPRRFLLTALVLSVIGLVLSLLLGSASFALPVIFPYEIYAYYNVFMYNIWAHFVIYLLMFVINLVQIVITSISIHKMPAYHEQIELIT